MPPDVVVILTDQERAAPVYEDEAVRAWRSATLTGRRWFLEHGVSFERHYTGSLACVPSRPTLFTGQYPDVHGVTQTDGLGKDADDSAMRWLRADEVPTLGHWFRAAGYDTHYQGKWHLSHADLHDDSTGRSLATNDDSGVVDESAVASYREADRLDPFGFSGWIGPEPHGGALANSGLRRDPLTARRASSCSRYGLATTRSAPATPRRRPCPHRPRPTRTCPTSRPPRLRSGRPIRRATRRFRPTSTTRTPMSTDGCTTACTPRSTLRSTRCDAR
jgi:arylsulfatase A-like enzyme